MLLMITYLMLGFTMDRDLIKVGFGELLPHIEDIHTAAHNILSAFDMMDLDKETAYIDDDIYTILDQIESITQSASELDIGAEILRTIGDEDA